MSASPRRRTRRNTYRVQARREDNARKIARVLMASARLHGFDVVDATVTWTAEDPQPGQAEGLHHVVLRKQEHCGCDLDRP